MKSVGNTLLVCLAIFAFAHGMTHAVNENDFMGGWAIGVGMAIAVSNFFEDL